jgi:ribonuclease R
LRGERTGIRYAIGTRVRVQVSRVDLDGRKIDFRLVREGEELGARALKDKGIATGGVPAKASTKRSARKKPEPSSGERSEHAPGAAPQSAMQAFRSAVKKAANKMKGRKPRR